MTVERRERGVRFAVRGRDGRHRSTTVVADRDCDPATAGPRCASRSRCRRAAPRRSRSATSCTRATSRRPRRRGARPRRAATPDEWLGERTAVVTDDELFNRLLRRSLLDMRMLHSSRGGDGYYAAGVPWYATLFGRDSLIAATQMLAFDPPMAAQTLRVLAGLIGTRDDPAHDEDPGKVLHELRAGEVARLGLSPLARYYGTVDATRCSSACCPSTPTGAATWRCSRSCAARSTRCSAGSTAPATATATGCSSTAGARRRRPAQPGLEGLRRGGARRARRAARAAGHAGRAAGLRAARQAPARAPVRAVRRRASGRGALLRRGGRAARAARALLAARPRLRLDGLRRRRPAERGARLQPGAPAVGHPRCRRRAPRRCATR